MYAHIQMANKALISPLKECLQLRTMMHNKNKMLIDMDIGEEMVVPNPGWTVVRGIVYA